MIRGRSQTREYKIWAAMKRRCCDPKLICYENYGARGIAVCERWKSFENFLADMGPRPSSEHSIDRVNNDGNYEPSNCRWATRQVQNSNMRRNRWFEYRGEMMTLAEAIRRSGTEHPKMTVISRINSGLSLEEALTTPKGALHHPKARVTHCIRGHEFTPDNTYWQAAGRTCRTCKQAHDRQRSRVTA